jgi:mitogen-activated protein kinase 1/3
LKPVNLLVNSNCDLKIGDFGLGRVSEPEEPGEFLIEYVTTRWYRAPELLLHYPTYGTPIDIWSIGCILAEIITRKPLFPVTGTLNQLQLITSVIGSATLAQLEGCVNPKAREYMLNMQYYERIPFEVYFDGCEIDSDQIDFLEKILVWNPKERATVDELLDHLFLSDLHDFFDEPITQQIEYFEFESMDISIEDLRVLLWKEVLKYHPEFQS